MRTNRAASRPTIPAGPPPRPRETHQHAVAGVQLAEPALVAEHAQVLARDSEDCALCEQMMLRGERAARLAGSGRWAHTSCVGQA